MEGKHVLFVVDHARLKLLSTDVGGDGGVDASAFVGQWRRDLGAANSAHAGALTALWTNVWAKIAGNPRARGVRPIEALQIYASGCDHHDTETALLSTRSGTGDPNPNPGDGPTELGTLLQHLKDVREVAVLNSESLTKAIAKYDERALSRRARQLTAEPNGTHAPIASEIRATVRDPANANDGDPLDRATISPPPPSGGVPAGADESWVLSPGGSDAEVLSLSTELLPLLFASGITQAETNLTEMVEMVRAELMLRRGASSSPSETVSTVSTVSRSSMSEGRDDISSPGSGMEMEVVRRGREWSWLLGLVSRMPGTMLDKLVAHRGFHCIKDGTDRPIENTLEAYETAWTAGIHMCECDIALTKDEQLVLAHDSSYARLALLPLSPMSPLPHVTEMTYGEVLKTRLLSGARAPLLSDVLESARFIAEASKMVIEIKPGNSDVPAALYRLLRAKPELVSSIAVVMSFDLFVIHKFAELFGDGAIPGADRVNLLFLTVAQSSPPDQPWECEVNLCTKGSADQVPGWLNREKSRLDGIYLQFEPSMLEPSGQAELLKLTQQVVVGVWGYSTDPDSTASFETLVAAGVKFVNTDLPRTFEE